MHFKYVLCGKCWKSYLSQAAPDLGLDGRVHLLLINGHGDELVQDGGDSLALGVIRVLTEAHQVEKPRCHVLQTQVLQLYTWKTNDISKLFINMLFS